MIFLALLLTAWLLLLTALVVRMRRRDRQHARRINRYLAPNGQQDIDSEQQQSLFVVGTSDSGWRRRLRRTRQRLSALFTPGAVKRLILIQLFALTTLTWATAELPLVWRLPLLTIALTAILVAVYRSLAVRQHRDFEQQLPTAIATISRAVSAGVSVPQAMQHAAEITGPVGETFQRVVDLLAIGVSLDDALEDACLRVNDPGFKFFAVTLQLNQQTGGQLSQVLRQLMNSLHERKAMRQKALSMTAEPRISAKIIAALPPAFLLLFWYQAPHIFDYLLYEPAGQYITLYAVISIALGMLIIRQMAKVEA